MARRGKKNSQKRLQQQQHSQSAGNGIQEIASPHPVQPNPPPATQNEAQQGDSIKQQYHHYIPRFIIRNFAIDDHLKHSKERHDVYYYSLEEQRLRIADVDTSYGVIDMYADIQNIENLHWVELKLSELEQSASGIIRRIIDLEHKEVRLTFSELIDLRKFLWTMSFRYPERRRQYTEGRFSELGREVQTEFMNTRGRQTSDDVWLENMRGFLSETQDDFMDNSLLNVIGGAVNRDIGLIEQINYQHWVMTTFLCIWEAEEPYEFIFTDNGFNVWEGDCGLGFSSMANHYFYPISPRRIIVASKCWFKPNLNMFEASYLEISRRSSGIDPLSSVLAKVEHIPPKVQYHGICIDAGLLISADRLDEGKEEIKRRRLLTTYTYQVVTVKKYDVDTVNACLLNEVASALSFRHPTAMIRTIRHWRKMGKKVDWRRDIFPPGLDPAVPSMLGLSLEQFQTEVSGDLDLMQLSRSSDYLDALERDLKDEVNRTHPEVSTQSGVIENEINGCWSPVVSEQQSKDSWCRSGRQRRLSDEQFAKNPKEGPDDG